MERRFRRHRGVVLHAMGGMGKTALATEAAQWWTRSGLFRDGACFLSFDQFTSAERVVQVLGTYCEGPRFGQLPDTEQRRRAIEYFQQRKVLMVWDNYESALPQFNDGFGSPYTDAERRRLAELFQDLTTGSGEGCVLVTCRPGETGLPGGQKMELRGLARPDTLWLLHRILEREGFSLSDPQFSRDKLDPLLSELADHPLSLELVGPHLRTLSPETIRAEFGTLLEQFQQDAAEERNRSLLASLEFSRRHLSLGARGVLPWLGLFTGGVFEISLLMISQIKPTVWKPIRQELESAALLRVEYDPEVGGRTFLHFHPTLAIACADPAVVQQPETRERFIGVYHTHHHLLDGALRGSRPRFAMAILSREEANYRRAIHWAVADGKYSAAAAMGATFLFYLQMSGRRRERDVWVQWLRDAVIQGDFTEAAAAFEREYAWLRFIQGDQQDAVRRLQALHERLCHTVAFDPSFQLAAVTMTFGRVLVLAGSSAQAIQVLKQAVAEWESLIVKSGGKPWEALLAMPTNSKAANELSNLSATMVDLANALSALGHHDDALAVAEQALRIQQKLGNVREIASIHGLSASILMAAGHYGEADARYERVLAVARQIGDRDLEGVTLQHQGGLAMERNQLDRATRLFQLALQLFQEARHQVAEMMTYNSLANVELNAGRLAEASAWSEKSREMAVMLEDEACRAAAAQTMGIISQQEGLAAREEGNEPAAQRHFTKARRFAEESLRIEQALDKKPAQANSWSQLAQIHLLLGDLPSAERHAHNARRIRESLRLKEVWKDYSVLSKISQARGDRVAAAEWIRKRDEILNEQRRRAAGGGGQSSY
jgi:tetratricopeptide (TPR) repeat protein